MKILITGDREWSDVLKMMEILTQFPAGTIIIHGACRGADNMAHALGEELEFVIRSYPASWHEFGKRAGALRNQSMLDQEHLEHEPFDLCLAFHNEISRSRGTRDMMSRCKKANIETRLIQSDAIKTK
jgi:hypothetical protein